MFEEYVSICFAVEKCKGIHGRKKFQKIFYLAKRADMPIHETFKWNMFGPYSEELASEIDSLCNMEFLSEKKLTGMEYSYKITEKGSRFLEKSLPKEEQILYNRLTKILEILNTFSSQNLEKIASIAFLLDEGYDDPYIKTFLKYAKQYSPEEIEKGKKMLSDLIRQFEEA
jgi:uncharacterized protein